MRFWIFLSLILFLTSCVNSILSLTDLSKLDIENQSIADDTVREFAAACMPNGGKPRPFELQEGDWALANDEILKGAGLERLRKKVLEIPGGGGRFKEEQRIYYNAKSEVGIILNLESRFEKEVHSGTKCELYAQAELLPTCTALGELIKKPPDHNQKYVNNGSHFISWNLLVGNSPAKLTCKLSPKSRVMPYRHITLTLSTDKRAIEKSNRN